MVDIVHVFCADEYLGELKHDTDGDRYEYFPKSDTENQKNWIWLTNADKDPAWFKETLYDTRVFPKNRINARELLKSLELTEYDPWKIFKKTRMISNDMFWISRKMEPEWFWDHHQLAPWHPDYTAKTGRKARENLPVFRNDGDEDIDIDLDLEK
jgi:hypothetical protein